LTVQPQPLLLDCSHLSHRPICEAITGHHQQVEQFLRGFEQRIIEADMVEKILPIRDKDEGIEEDLNAKRSTFSYFLQNLLDSGVNYPFY